MSPSDQCRKAGLDGLSDFVRISGESEQNLLNWHKKRPLRFELLLIGAAEKKKRQ